MNKTELIKAIAEKTGRSQKEEKKSIEALLETIGNTLASGDDIRIIGFGRFNVINVPARNVRNPRTGEILRTNGTKKVRFKGGSNLQGKVS